MPCNSDYLEANHHEREASRVLALLDELDGKQIPDDYGSGYDRRVYNRAVDLDALVAALCKRLQGEDVSRFSLEMQIWWRDHQRADAERARREQAKAEIERKKQEALSKLTAEDRKALGL